METTMKYEEAVKELETIVRRIEANELDIDTLSTELKRAQELLRLCKDKLTKADEEVKKVLKNNLVCYGITRYYILCRPNIL